MQDITRDRTRLLDQARECGSPLELFRNLTGMYQKDIAKMTGTHPSQISETWHAKNAAQLREAIEGPFQAQQPPPKGTGEYHWREALDIVEAYEADIAKGVKAKELSTKELVDRDQVEGDPDARPWSGDLYRTANLLNRSSRSAMCAGLSVERHYLHGQAMSAVTIFQSEDSPPPQMDPLDFQGTLPKFPDDLTPDATGSTTLMLASPFNHPESEFMEDILTGLKLKFHVDPTSFMFGVPTRTVLLEYEEQLFVPKIDYRLIGDRIGKFFVDYALVVFRPNELTLPWAEEPRGALSKDAKHMFVYCAGTHRLGTGLAVEWLLRNRLNEIENKDQIFRSGGFVLLQVEAAAARHFDPGASLAPDPDGRFPMITVSCIEAKPSEY